MRQPITKPATSTAAVALFVTALAASAGTATQYAAVAQPPPAPPQSTASAERPLSDKYIPGTVTISFEGGNVATDLGNVLLSLIQKQSLVPTKEHVIADGEQPCDVLIHLGYPGCSVELRSVLDRLNPRLVPSQGRVKNGDTMRVPDVWLRRYRTARKFSDSVKAEQRRSSTIKNNWSSLGIAAARSGRSAEIVYFNAFELILPASTPTAQAALLGRVAPLKSGNVRVNSIPFVAAAAKLYSHPGPDVYQAECMAVGAQPPPTVDYRTDYVESDADAARLVASRPQGSQRARVYVVDLAVDPTPNLAGAVEGQLPSQAAGAWRCAWIAASERDHATHLASIIASQNNGFGFVGVSPGSLIHSYELIKDDPASVTGLSILPGKEAQLADEIVQNSLMPGRRYVYLVATNFSDFPSALIRFGQITPEKRFSRDLENNIKEQRPLFVVAAGQSDPPIQLSSVVPMSPQDLGDQRGVLIVTACKSCTHNDTRLWDEANYSPTDVHVAAPGGDPMLGWVNRSGVGALSGTSQSAAFAAGVLAEMVGRFPDTYGAAENAKKRIQVTSWPLYKGNGNDDYLKLAAGIIDPNLALLDPAQNWIKDANGWQPVKARGFSKAMSNFRVGAALKSISTSSIARIVQITPDGVPPQYVLYIDSYADDHDVRELGEVKRLGPVTNEDSIALNLCDGTTLRLSDLKDVIVANAGFGDSPCAS